MTVKKNFQNYLRRSHKTLTASLFTALIATFGYGCAHNHPHEEDSHQEKTEEEHSHEGLVVFSAEQASAGGVQTMQVSHSAFENVIACSGQIMAANGQERTLTSPLAGVVSFAGEAINQGTKVSSGQTLFSISANHIIQPDASPELRANLANAQANLKRAKEQYADRLITKSEYDAAVAEVNSAQAALRNPGITPVKHSSVSSPLTGFITQCFVKPGEYVELGAPLATVSSGTRMQLRADVPQSYAAALSGVSGANIIIPGERDEPLSLADLNAKVVSYARSSVDGLYIPVIMEFDNPGGLTAGSTAEVYLLTSGNDSAITVPRTALTEEEGIYFVYVEESPEHYRKQPVKRGRDNGITVEILSGLNDGETVVTQGAVLLKLAANSGKAPEGHSHNH